MPLSSSRNGRCLAVGGRAAVHLPVGPASDGPARTGGLAEGARTCWLATRRSHARGCVTRAPHSVTNAAPSGRFRIPEIVPWSTPRQGLVSIRDAVLGSVAAIQLRRRCVLPRATAHLAGHDGLLNARPPIPSPVCSRQSARGHSYSPGASAPSARPRRWPDRPFMP